MRRILLGFVIAMSVVGCQTSPASVATTGPSAVAPTDSPAANVATPSPAPSDSLTPTATPTATPSPSPTPSPTPRPTATPTPVCLVAQLKARVTGWQGAMGSQIASVTVANTSSTSCKVQGTPEVELVDANGVILIDSQTAGANGLPHVSPGDHVFVLGHDGFVTTEVQVSNYCGTATPALPTTVAFVMPSSAGRIVAAPGPGGSTPGCLGAPGSPGSIAMNGWAG